MTPADAELVKELVHHFCVRGIAARRDYLAATFSLDSSRSLEIVLSYRAEQDGQPIWWVRAEDQDWAGGDRNVNWYFDGGDHDPYALCGRVIADLERFHASLGT